MSNKTTQNNTEQQTAQCRSCKRDIRLNSRRCPYCGILNPTVKTKEADKVKTFGAFLSEDPDRAKSFNNGELTYKKMLEVFTSYI